MEASFPTKHFDQSDQVGMLQLAQHAYFSHGDFPDCWVGIVFGISLDGDNLASLSVDTLEHDTLRQEKSN